MVRVQARDEQGKTKSFEAVARVDTPEEVAYYRNGGILPYVLRQML
jgi:aconitate hydratase